MFQIMKNEIKILLVAVFALAAAVAACIYIVKNDEIAEALKNKDCVSFSVLLYGTEKMFPGRLDAYVILYDKKNNILKILSVNSDVVVFRKMGESKSLKVCFNENLKKGVNKAIEQFYSDLRKIIGKAAATDFYINTSFELFSIAAGKNEKLKTTLLKNSFKDRNLESLNRIETIEYLLHLTSYDIIKIGAMCSFIGTNVSRLSFMSSLLRFNFLNPVVMFCEMPVKYVKTSIEPDRQNIKEFLNKVYYAGLVLHAETDGMLIDVKNASKKPRMAEKVVWLLRENNFDVLDWSNFSADYDKTLIKDYKGNFAQALRIVKVLKAGRVIVSYNSKVYCDMDVFIGRDCAVR